MIKTVIFDLGNVLISYKPLEYLKKRYSDEDAEFLLSAIFKSDEWCKLDNGTISEDSAWDIFIERDPDKEAILKEVKDDFYNIFTPIESSVRILKKLRARGYTVLYLSNIHIGIFGHVIEKYDFFEEFHGGIISAKVNMLKPDEDIYLSLISKYNIKPEEAVFIDDTASNTDAAESLGFKTINLFDADNLENALREIGVI